jgi:hypothetical protein
MEIPNLSALRAELRDDLAKRLVTAFETTGSIDDVRKQLRAIVAEEQEAPGASDPVA